MLTHLRVHSSLLFSFQEYERALKYIRTLLRNEPGNKQAMDLEKLIDKALKKGNSTCVTRNLMSWIVLVNKNKNLTLTCCCLDGLVGMAIVGGIGVGVVGLAGLIGLAVSKGAAKS